MGDDKRDDKNYKRSSSKYSTKDHSKYPSRSRSRSSRSQFRNKYDNLNDKLNNSDKSNPKFKISSGPIMFQGTQGAQIIEKDFKVPEPRVKLKKQYAEEDFTQKKENEKMVFENDMEQNQKQDKLDNEYKAFEWAELQEQADKDWYDQEEEQNAYGEDQQDQLFVGDQEKFRQMEDQMTKLKQKARGLTKALDAKAQDHNKWEESRMLQSGLFTLQQQQQDLDETEEQRVQILVHDFKPPFLDGKTIYTKQLDTVSIVKDPNCDMALLAKKGSKILKFRREQKERQKSAKNISIEGSMLGNLLKIPKEKDKEQIDDEKEKEKDIFDENGEYDYKKSNQYSSAFTGKKNEAVSEFAKSKSIKEQREFLPVFTVRDELMNIINENKVIIIVGHTGSGKTTQLTQYLYEEGYSKDGSVIGCTQPRRVAAVSVAKRVAEEMDVELGQECGYTIRFEDNTTKGKTKIKYMTDGVLLRESLNDPDLDQYSAIIMDEAHERSLNTDVLFGILKKVAQRRKDIKIIITSATMNAEKFSLFFGGAAIFEIPGRTFPVRVQFDKSPADDYVQAAVKKAVEIHIQQDMGDILIFMTGQEDIEATCSIIEDKLAEIQDTVPPMIIMPIYSQLRSEDQAKIFESSHLRKCIVATNIAETSLTLDGVRYVIDTGYCKLKVYNPRVGMDALQVTPISQANADQRKGRAGRTGPGTCYRLYSDSNYRADMLENNIPEIQRTNLANVVLLLKTLNIDNLLDFDWMDPPPQDTILNSMYQLWVLGCLDELGQLTELGKKMAQFPLDPPLSKMLIEADKLGCLEEILTVVSMLSIPQIFYRPKGREEESDQAREKLFVPESDHLTLLNIYDQWKKHSYSGEWCRQCFIQYKSMRKVREVRMQLKDIATQQGLKITSCKYNYDLVRKAITSAYFINACRIKSIGDYYNLRNGLPCKIHPSSALFTLGFAPDYAVYHDLVLTTKEYMHVVTTVDPYWLQEMGPMFFSVKETSKTSNTYKSKSELTEKGYQIMEKRIEEAQKVLEQKEVIDKKLKEKEKEERIKKELMNQASFGGRQQKFKKNNNSTQNQQQQTNKIQQNQKILSFHQDDDEEEQEKDENIQQEPVVHQESKKIKKVFKKPKSSGDKNKKTDKLLVSFDQEEEEEKKN